jgi:hypothetical protein
VTWRAYFIGALSSFAYEAGKRLESKATRLVGFPIGTALE